MLPFLSNHKLLLKMANALAVLFIFIFPIVTFFQLYPFQQSLADILNASNDDWCLYINTALDIKHNGLLIHNVKGDYDYPNGFFYSYFVAFCFSLFGENPAPVYILQSALLGCTIALVYNSFKTKMSPLSGLLLIVTLIVFAFLDVHNYYTFRLLSENLVIFTLVLFFYFLFKGLENSKRKPILVSAVFLGLSILTRPNLFPVGIVLAIVLCFLSFKGKITFPNLILFLVLASAVISLLALRNKLVSGHFTFFPVNSFGFFQSYFLHPNILFEDMYKKFMFCIGFLQVLYPSYHFRPHWVVMWLAYLIYWVIKLKQKEKFEVWEIISHLFILTYFGLLVFVIDTKLIVVYGFRYIIPALFFVLPFVFIGFDKLQNKLQKNSTED